MIPTHSTNLRRGGESRSTQNENDQLIRLRHEDEKQKRRREWMRRQELEKQHERLKKQLISDYERKRKEAMKSKQTSSRRSRSKSNSPTPKSNTLSKKLDGSTSGVPLFKGPEGTQISSIELRRIKVDIRRNIPAKEPVTTELQRDILNPEDVILKRREGKMLNFFGILL